jgi:hypothetical protein
MALLGPGPAGAYPPGAITGATPYANGDIDGADGPGFCTQLSLYGTCTFSSYTPSPPTLTVANASPSLPTIPPAAAALLPTVVSLGGAGSPDAHVPILSITGNQIFLGYPLQNAAAYSATTTIGLLRPAGHTWGPYLQPTQFKIAYVLANVQGSSAGTASNMMPTPGATISVPILTDIWGGPILYFPKYNAYQNRPPHNANNPVSTTPTYNPCKTLSPLGLGVIPTPGSGVNAPPVTVGPIFGSPSTVLSSVGGVMMPNYYYNTPVDTNNDTVPSVFWSGPLGAWGVRTNSSLPTVPSPLSQTADPYTPMSTGQVAAILYKLGDQNINNTIDNGETFALELPYFMISAGPDGVFTELFQGNAPTSVTSNNWQVIINKADDIYSFAP